MVDSKSTDKLQILCNSIKDQILLDQTLKDRASKIEITWKNIESGNEGNLIVVPNLKIEFKP